MAINVAEKTKAWLNYDEAWLYCLTFSYKGYKDWRMPTEREFNAFRFTQFELCWYEDDPCLEDTYARKEWLIRPVRTVNA